MTDYYNSGGSSGGENFAGFGLRRFQRDAEEQERERQRALWEQEERERQEQQRRWEEHQWWTQRQAEEAAQAAASTSYHARYYQQQHEGELASSSAQHHDWHGCGHGQDHDEYPGGEVPAHPDQDGAYDAAYDDSSAFYASPASMPDALPSQDARQQSRSEPREQHHQHYHQRAGFSKERQPAQPQLRSDTLETTSSGTSIGLAYDRASTAPTIRPSQGGRQDDSHDSHLTNRSNLDGSNGSRDSAQTAVPQAQRQDARSVDRDTCYEDDYEEDEDDNDITPEGWATVGRFSHFVSSSDAARGALPASSAAESLPVPDSARQQSEASHHRATLFVTELPKAKCADCGELFSFEELSDHSCLPRGPSQASMLTIKLPSPSLETQSLNTPSTPSTAGLGPRSPFFDKYSHVVGDNGRLSPAFAVSTPGSARSEFLSRFESSGSASAATSPTEATPLTKLPIAKGSLPSVVEPTGSSNMQRSASDGDQEAAERRRMIEQQRAAKKSATAAATATTVLAAMRFKTAGRAQDTNESPAQKDATSSYVSGKTGQGREVPHVKQPSSSSVSSRASSHLDPFFPASGRSTRQRQNSNGTSSSAALTPSSSYDRFSETAATSPATTSCSPVSKTSRSGAQRAAKKGEIDLAGIEDLMRGLTASPQSMSRELDAEERDTRDDRNVRNKSDSERRRRERERQRDREREAELEAEARRRREREMDREIERLKEKEKLRQLLKLRQREKEARQRKAAKKCCICDCSLASSRTPSVERDGKLFCAKDWKDLYLPKCRRCGLSVEKGAVKASDGALKGVFHRACFTCFHCEQAFDDGSFYVYKNQPFCALHYHQANGSVCKSCGHGVEGDCRQTESGDRFHPQCFRCEYDSKGLICRQLLDEYFNVDGRRLCEVHADKVSRRLQRQGKKGLDLKADRRRTMLRHL